MNNPPQCISIIVKNEINKKIGEWIKDREAFLDTVKPDSDIYKGTKELIKNLENSKNALDKISACESMEEING